ncbi:unnamed protein product [Mytilus coruscus]|uniref:SET domain-containing protein n=1 Tax=Mytilus coruscus TaxID=42192 RepID=A0A6J8D1I8_MYTCO|nr:unnamed protein product [Mytilus coruscus]
MPRNPNLRGTNRHPRDVGAFVPYIEDFVKLLKSSDIAVKSTDLKGIYLRYVSARTGAVDLYHQASSGFYRRFKKLAIIYKIKISTKPRGYYVDLPRISRKTIHCATEESISGRQFFERKFVNKNVGCGIFAVCNIPSNFHLTEYKGQWITKSANEDREKEYTEKNLPPVAVFDPEKSLVLDANRNKRGHLFEEKENLARYFNHSKQFPNCKLISVKHNTGLSYKKLFLVSKVDIPKGAELVWDYGETDKESILTNPWLTG